MTPLEARVIDYCENLLIKYGLWGWTVELDNAVRRAGQCTYSSMTISLSRKMIKVRPVEDSFMTCLHEVAHARTGSGHGHDKVWKRTFREMGGDGERGFTLDATARETVMKYVATCPGCGHKYFKNRAVDDRARRCAACPEHPVVEYVEVATGKPMVRTPYRPRKPRRRRITLPDGRSFLVPARF